MIGIIYPVFDPNYKETRLLVSGKIFAVANTGIISADIKNIEAIAQEWMLELRHIKK